MRVSGDPVRLVRTGTPGARRARDHAEAGRVQVDYDSDNAMRIVEQMRAAIRLATLRYAEGAPASDSIEATNEAIALAVELPAEMFVGMSPQSMLSLLELSNLDDRVIGKVAEALVLQADVLETEGLLIEASVRREQAAAMLEFIDPARAN